MHRTIHARATLIGFTAVLLWGGLAPVVAATAHIPQFQLNAVAFFLAFLVSLGYWRHAGIPLSAPFRLPAAVWALGLYGLYGFHACYFTALRRAPPVEALLIVNLWPLMLVLMSTVFTRERLAPWHMAGTALGFGGVVTLVSRGGAAGFDPAYASGYAFAFAAAFIWASYSVLCRKVQDRLPTYAMGAFCLGTSALFLLSHLLFESAVPLGAVDLLLIALLGVGPVGIAFYTWDHGMKHGDVRLLGALCYIGPMLGTTLLIAFGFSSFSWRVVVAAIMILGGAALSSVGSMRIAPGKRVKMLFKRAH